jgi:LDH2 family malate/lactate/ureidoglycolate dehydrogenase
MYVRDIESGTCSGTGSPEILNERAATAWVDGKNLLGPVVGNYCMQLAINKARAAGIGWVTCKGVHI